MCEYCNARLFVQIKRLSKQILTPLTHVEEVQQELINLTGIEYIPIKSNYCPICGTKMKEE
mgnify:CR=1 FL=1